MLFQNPQLKKRMTIMVITLIIVFGGLVLFNVIKGIMIKRFFAHFQAPTVTVSSVVVNEKNWEPYLTAVGNFSAINGVDVNAQAMGNVVAIHFTSGQYIGKNQPLIDIDDSVDQATLKFNQADLTLQQVNYKRQTDLLKRNATSTSSVDEAQAKLLESQANLEKTQALIQQKHITSPFAGQLGIRQIDLGQYIAPGETAIVTLQSLDPLFLEFYLPEQLLGRLQIDQGITFGTEQNPNLLFKGKITAINSKIDTNTHMIKVQATVPNCPSEALKHLSQSPLLRVEKNELENKSVVVCDTQRNQDNNITAFHFIPGMFASIKIEQPMIPNVLVVPSTAISYTLYGDSVFVIEKTKQNTLQVKRVFVTTGEQQGNDTVIAKGLKKGQLVVSSGELKLQDGTPVTINNDFLLHNTQNPSLLGQ
jgi:membrane fusion protein, multidrug efflux system